MKTTILLSCFCLATVAHATTTFIDFGGSGGNLGTTATFSGVVATAEATTGRGSNDLYQKMDGGDENGLGLTSDPADQHEITPGFYIQLNISTILGDNPITINMESTTGSDAWSIYETNTAGVTTFTGATLLLSGTTEGDFSLGTVADHYIDVTATSGNVLLSQLDYNTSSVPEPASLLLGGLGLAALGLLRLRRRA